MNNNGVFRMLAMVTQVGISMLAPIILCTFLGVVLDNKLNLPFSAVLPLFVLGAAAGFRNCYVLINSILKKDKKSEEDTDKTE